MPNSKGQLIDPLEDLDPSNDPGYPQDPADLDEWLEQNAARAILVTEFTASRIDSLTGKEVRDDPRNFITFSPTPLPNADGIPGEPNQNVSPFAGAIFTRSSRSTRNSELAVKNRFPRIIAAATAKLG